MINTHKKLFVGGLFFALVSSGCQVILPRYKQELPKFIASNELAETIEDSDDLAYNLERRELPSRAAGVLSGLFPQGTRVNRLLRYFEEIGGRCAFPNEEDGEYKCNYCAVKYDQVFDYGWKLRRLEVLWELNVDAASSLDSPKGQTSEERQTTRLSFHLFVVGKGILPSALEEPDLTSCDVALRRSKDSREGLTYAIGARERHVVY